MLFRKKPSPTLRTTSGRHDDSAVDTVVILLKRSISPGNEQRSKRFYAKRSLYDAREDNEREREREN